ncbi:MAG TPA: hypothetical protein VNB23_17475 [Ramlibacter sp.]|nr:hypothetical protein [Ramlibacter sp.]
MKIASLSAIAVTAAVLSGCYVVPLQSAQSPAPAPATTTIVMPPPPAQPLTFSARLYPANDLASGYGMVAAVVTNDLNGRGHFSTAINGENFTGEATRSAGSSRDGVANGAGNRGSYISCRYAMNSATLGTGTCRMSNGALFTMHVGS